MQIDNNALKKITNMTDSELRQVITSVAKEKGISMPNISENDLAKIRTALAGISPADLERLRQSFSGKGGR